LGDQIDGEAEGYGDVGVAVDKVCGAVDGVENDWIPSGYTTLTKFGED